MRSILPRPSVATVCLAIVLFLVPGINQAQSLSIDEEKAINHILSFYKKMAALGDAKAQSAMARLEAAVKAKKITFGEVPDNDNAISDPSTQQITINSRYIAQVNDSKDDALVSRADLAATIIHEFRHLDQSSYKTTGAKLSQMLGLGNRAEREAWGESFNALTNWILLTHKKLRNSNASARERAWIAKELGYLCDTWIVTRNSYNVDNYGAMSIDNPDNPEGPRVPLEDAFACIEKIKDYATKQAILANQMTLPYDGVYSGKFELFFVNGVTRILVRGENVDVSLSNADLDKGLRDYFDGIRRSMGGSDVGGSSSTGIFKRLSGTIDADGNITAYTEDRKFMLTGNISENKGSGTLWSLEREKTPMGRWQAAK